MSGLCRSCRGFICRMKAKDALRKPSQGVQNQLHLLVFPEIRLIQATLGRRILETVGSGANIIPLSSR